MKDGKHLIYVKDEERIIECNHDEVILEALKRENVYGMAKGCFGGGCGICKIQVLDGQYEIIQKMSRAHINPAEREEGYVLGCCVKLKSNVTIIKEKTI